VSGRRLPMPAGSRLDRGKAIAFEFNGRAYTGFRGDTVASALIANQVGLIGRSFKLHRPRGIYSCGIDEPTGLVDIGVGAHRTPNARASVVEIQEGLVAQSVNCWPNVRFDAAAMAGWFSRVLPAGFYYKTFKWPNWHCFEPTIRRMAGLGRMSRERDPDRYEEIAVNPDILVVGGGMAGLAAAISAAQVGAQTMLVTSSPVLGGTAGYRSDPQVQRLIEEAEKLNIRILTRTSVFGLYDHNLACARELVDTGKESAQAAEGVLRQRLWKIRARGIIAATGAFERPLIFPDNDRPGIMLAGAAEKYALAYGVACGRRIVVAANSDRAYAVASTLRGLGVDVVAIIDCRAEAQVADDQGPLSDVRIINDSTIASVSGGREVRGCSAAPVAGSIRKPERFDCDLILSAGGLTPAVHLHSQAGGKLRWLDEAAMFVPDGHAPGVVSVGACAGVFVRMTALSHASEVGAALARGVACPSAPVGGAGRALANTHVSRRGSKQFVDLQNDVLADDIALAAQENYRSVEHLKRYTTVGMGTDQGKTSNINALVLMGESTERAPPAVGTTKFRPPFSPVTMGVLAGRRVGSLYRPLKRLPVQAWHESRGAVFEEYGGWWRPAAYPIGSESVEEAALREASGVRRAVGIFDGTPLGKLEIFGPDAAAFLDLMYVGTMSTLAIGQARYGLLLNEHGVLVDDGIVARFGEQHYWVNTTSGGVERTAAAFDEWLQCEFGHLQVAITPVTSPWVNMTIAGPRAWDWLCAAGFDPALAPNRMKHMTIAATRIAGWPLRVLRVSFSGELGYEINVPVSHGQELFDRVWRLARDFDAVPYGVEALQTLRIEKGYIHIGADTDGTTLPGDVGFGRGVDRKSANFVGRRSLSRPVARDPARLQLVALVPADGRTLLPVGAHIAPDRPPTDSEGHVTSSAMSAVLGRPIALAMLARGAARTGERVRVHHLGTMIEAEVVTAPFVDPTGQRVNG
jgi:sarcosine oxidase, subunit alpha